MDSIQIYNCLKCLTTFKLKCIDYIAIISPYINPVINPLIRMYKKLTIKSLEGYYYDKTTTSFFYVTKQNGYTVNKNTGSVNDVVYYKISNEDNTYSVVPCDYSFLSVCAIYNDCSYDLELSDDNYNFFCSDNVLDFRFFKWLLKHKYNVITDSDDALSISIIDNNCNMITLNKDAKMILNDTKYELISNS
jgi:hypothetical protein